MWVEGEVEGVGLAAVGLGEDGEAAAGEVVGVGGAGDLEGGVAGAVVDDQDADVFVGGEHDGPDGPDDDLLLVVGGDDDGDARLVVGRGVVFARAQAVDDGEDADDDEARAHQDVADEEDADDDVVEEGDEEEGDGVDEGEPVLLPAGDGGHDLLAGLADELADGDDLVAAGAEGLDEHGQGGHGGGAVAAAVVEQDDGATSPGLLGHGVDLLEDAVGDLLRGLAGVLVPVVGVDLVADDDVAEALDGVDGGGLVVGVGLLVDGVGGAEVERLDAELGGEETLGEGHLEVEVADRDLADVGVGEGVVADLVAFTVEALEQAEVVLGLFADDEEGSGDLVFLEDVEDLRGPLGIGAVVEGEGDLLGVVADVLDGVGQGVGDHLLGDDGAVVEGDGVVVVEGDLAAAGLGLAGDPHDVAFAVVVDVVAGFDQAEILDGIGLERGVPDLPEGVVLGAEAPEGDGLDAEGAGGTHLVEDGGGVEEPDLMADVGVLVVVGEVGVEGVVVELDVGLGVGGGLPGLLGGDVVDGEDLVEAWGRGLMGLLAGGLGRGQGHGPVVAVAADGADDLVLGDGLEDFLEVVDEPVLVGDGAGAGVDLVLIVVHQEQAVGVVGHELEVEVVVADGGVDVEAEIAGVEVVVEGGDEGLVAGLGRGGDALEVEGEAAVAGVLGQQGVGLFDEAWRGRLRSGGSRRRRGRRCPWWGRNY